LTQQFNQEEHPVAFWSSQLTPAQKNYSVTELECAAVVAAIRHFEYLLLDKHFTVITDHSALQWLPTKTSSNKRLARAALYLSSFDFTIEYRRGKLNAAADALSRNPQPRIAAFIAPSPNLPSGPLVVDPGYPRVLRLPRSSKSFRPLFVRSNLFAATILRLPSSRLVASVANPSASASSASSSSAQVSAPLTTQQVSTYADFTVEDSNERSKLIEAQCTDSDCKYLIDYLSRHELPANIPVAARQQLIRSASRFVVSATDGTTN
jgi:hypothetical protein